MASHQGMLTLVLTVTLVVVPSSGTMLTVTLSSTNVTCPTENTCLTLSEYAQYHSEYFNHSNITLQFLPGNHTLDVDLTITSIQTQYLEILGNTTSPTPSIVICSHKVGFEFRDISKVRISDVTFASCGRGYQIQGSPLLLHYTIRFSSVQLTEITNCVFRDSFGSAVGILNSTTLVSGNNTFASNCRIFSGGCPYSSECICNGGGIETEGSNVTFHGNNTFLGNSARFGGGVWAFNSVVTFHNNNTFHENSAEYGGGVWAFNSVVTFYDKDTFHENSAEHGGGVGAQESIVTFHDDNTFHENSADYNGGGVFAMYSNVTFHNDNTFHGNTATRGGGVFAMYSSVTFHDDNTFNENSADYDGGGVITYHSNERFSGTGTFTDNTAQYGGGGIYSDNSIIDIGGITKVQNNTARQDGGGIYMSRTYLKLAGINNFTTNSAMRGGGILAAAGSTVVSDGMNAFIANKADISGGGFWVDNGTLILDGNNYFEECTARYEGGGISTYAATINLPGKNTFLSNSATLRGGGISARWSLLSFTNSSIFSKNFAESGGGIFIDNSTLDFGGLNTIERNSADLGGGIYMLNSSLDLLGNNSFILNSAAKDGGGIYARENGIIYLIGSNIFQGNTAAERGGGIFVKDSNLTSRTRTVSTNNAIIDFNETAMKFPGHSEFCRNSAMTGGGLYSIDSTLEFPETYTFNFTANMATNAGGGFATVGSTVNTIGSMAFETNSAMSGGGMYLEDTKVNLSGRNYFNQNHAHYEGGAVYIRAGNVNFSGADNFVSNSAAMRGGSISAACTNLTFSGNTTFCKSTSQQGGAIHVMASSITFECVTELWNNSAQYGGAMLSEKSTVSFGKPSCGGSDITPEHGSSFINNTALWGGAMHLDHHSSIRFHPSACVHFNYNKAREYGGAIFVVDTVGENTCPPVMDLPSRNECFFHVISNEISQMGMIDLIFEGNTAGKSGSVLYGGMLNKCNYSYSEEYTDTINLFNRSIVHENYTTETAISSDPMMCFCSESGSLECEYKVQNEDRFPGQKVNVSLIAVDQTYTPIQTDIHTNLISDEKHNSRVCESFSEEREGSCTNRSYTITSPWTTSKLLLYPTTASGNPIPAVLNVTFKDCPIGFEESNSTYECICDHRLQKFTNTCDIEAQTLLRAGTFWVNASFNNETLDGYIHHSQCPLNYCTKQQRYINLNNPDEQCDFNHTDLLCGKCRENFSLILGSFQCEECSSEYLVLLIPFAFAGVALVILLFLLKLTVATGTLHGLIFYANIVATNHHIFLPTDTHILARIFIAWLNLDLGIETCFYNGMDAYSKSWLQIAFPVYIWGIVGFLIYISKRSWRVTQLLGTNPVAVLDTLFLLSYTKLLRTIITALSLTTLHYPQEDCVVWLYDASIPIPKLIPFVVAALIFLVFLFLPYTLLLLLGQWFWAKSDYKLIKLCWEKHPRMKLSLKAILDPYHAPYKPQHCYWTGLLLLLRCVLLLVSAFNISGDKDGANLLAILSTVGGTLAVFGLSGRVYKSWYLNALEVSFLLNLIILTAATYHVRLVSGDQAAVAYISIGIAFLIFAGIITYHVSLQIKWKLQHIPRYFTKRNHGCENSIIVENSNAQNHQERQPRGPTMTVVDLRSPLDVINADYVLM